MPAQRYQVVNLHSLQSFLQEISKRNPAKNAIRLIMKNLSLDVKDANLQQIMNFAIFVEKRARNFPKKDSQPQNQHYWAFGEQKLFCILLPYFFFYYGLSINQFNEKDLTPLQGILISKASIQLYFQIKYFESLTNNFKINWNDEDCQNLVQFVNESNDQQQENMRWKNIAVKLFIKNGGVSFHSPRDCREMWTNHLNPKISKQSWDIREDCQLFTYIKEYGCKWSLISKKMKSMRTQHMVKNRALAIVKRYKFKTKKLTDRQAHLILEDLQKKLQDEPVQTDKIVKNSFAQIQKLNEQQIYSTEIAKQEVKVQQMHSMQEIYEVLDLSKERILIAPRQIDDNWQYNQDEPFNYPYFDNMGANLITFNDSLQSDLAHLSTNYFSFEDMQI